MDIIEVLRTRRTNKKFTATPVSRQALLELVDAARYAPSGANKNPWRFVIVTNRQTLDRLSQTHPHCRWLEAAQAAIAVVVDPTSTRYWLEDCSAAAYGIWLAATGRGLSMAWAAMHLSDDAQESARRQQLVREALSVPDQLYVPIVLGAGYSEAPVPERKRPSLDEIVHWDCYTAP